MKYEVEPEDREPLAFVDFEKLAPMGAGGRRAEMCDDAASILVTYAGWDETAARDSVFTEYDLSGEELLWSYVETLVEANGWDTYNSDTRFEVYARGDTRLKGYTTSQMDNGLRSGGDW